MQSLESKNASAGSTPTARLTAEDEELYSVSPQTTQPKVEGSGGADDVGDSLPSGQDADQQRPDRLEAEEKVDSELVEREDRRSWSRDKERRSRSRDKERSRSRTYDSDSDSDSSSASDDSDAIADRAAVGQVYENSVDFESSVNEKRMQAMKAEKAEGKSCYFVDCIVIWKQFAEVF